MRISLEEELLLNAHRKDCEYSHGLLSEAFLDEGILVCPCGKRIKLCCLLTGKKFIDLGDQLGELRDKLNDSFRNDRDAEVIASISTSFN